MSNPKRWIQSFTGKQVFPLNLKPEQIDVRDIAHALSLKCRFTGHVKHFYSVGQHTILGSRLVPDEFKLPFLLHEVSEVYLPDIAKPIKDLVYTKETHSRYKVECDESIDWEVLESMHADVIFEALGLSILRPLIDSPQVKQMDLAMLTAEKEQLFATPAPAPWGLPEPAAKITILEWGPRIVEAIWLRLFSRYKARDFTTFGPKIVVPA